MQQKRWSSCARRASATRCARTGLLRPDREAYDDVVVLESEDGTQTKWSRQAIAQQVDPVDPEGEASDDLAEGEADDAGIPGVTVSEDTPAEDDPRRDRL